MSKWEDDILIHGRVHKTEMYEQLHLSLTIGFIVFVFLKILKTYFTNY